MATIATKPRHVLRGIDGEILPPGQSRRRLEWAPIADSVLPSWIALSGGTVSVQTAANGIPGAVCTQTGGGHLMLNLGGSLMLHPNLTAASIRIIGLTSLGAENANQAYLRFENTATDRGIVLAATCNSNMTTMTRRNPTTSLGSSHRYPPNMSYVDGGSTAKYKFMGNDIGFHVNFEQGIAYAFDGDDVCHYWDIGSSIPRDSTILNPRITLVCPSGAALLVPHIVYDLHYG